MMAHRRAVPGRTGPGRDRTAAYCEDELRPPPAPTPDATLRPPRAGGAPPGGALGAQDALARRRCKAIPRAHSPAANSSQLAGSGADTGGCAAGLYAPSVTLKVFEVRPVLV